MKCFPVLSINSRIPVIAPTCDLSRLFGTIAFSIFHVRLWLYTFRSAYDILKRSRGVASAGFFVYIKGAYSLPPADSTWWKIHRD